MNKKRIGTALFVIFYFFSKIQRYYGLNEWVEVALGLLLFSYLGWIVVDGIVDMAKNRSRT